ncbi:MAG: glycosyltransferase [Alphaproteobacteria bacterium]|nr:glycosyltransferase [Alphaproteobacteria bacterium]
MAQDATPKIRVTFVLPSFAGGGAERVVLTLARNLSREKFQPGLVVLDGRGPLKNLVSEDVPVTDLNRPRLRHAWRPLAAALRERNSDVVVSTISHINLAVLMLRRRLGPATRIVARESNTPSASLASTRWPGLFRWLYRRYIPRADAILCPSQRVAAEFAGDFGIAPGKFSVMPHPVDVETVRRVAAKPQRTPGAGLRFVGAGRMTRQKGLDRLVDLLPALPEDTHLTLLGDGDQLDALRQRAVKCEVENRISFPGFTENPWGHFAGADAFLLPSRWEGMPNAVLEALAVGTPVIARSEAGGIGEIAATDGAVTIVDSNEAFAKAMRRTRPRSVEAPAASLLPERFSLDAVMAEFEDLLVSVVGGKS